jgi:hypothetical protein
MGAKTRAILRLGFIAWFAFLCAGMEAFHTCVLNGAPPSGDEGCADCCTLRGSREQASCNHAANSQIAQSESGHLSTGNHDGLCIACFFGHASRSWSIEVAPLLLAVMCDGGCVACVVKRIETPPCLCPSQARAPPLS